MGTVRSSCRLRHARRERRQRLRPLDHRHHLVVEVGMAGAVHDMAREHMAVAVDAEGQQHDALLAPRLRLARITLVLLQVSDQPALPRWLDARRSALDARRRARRGRPLPLRLSPAAFAPAARRRPWSPRGAAAASTLGWSGCFSGLRRRSASVRSLSSGAGATSSCLASAYAVDRRKLDGHDIDVSSPILVRRVPQQIAGDERGMNADARRRRPATSASRSRGSSSSNQLSARAVILPPAFRARPGRL